jgi:hypothetical protein
VHESRSVEERPTIDKTIDMESSSLPLQMLLLLCEIQLLHLRMFKLQQRQLLILKQQAQEHQVDQRDVQQNEELMTYASNFLSALGPGNSQQLRYLEQLEKYQRRHAQQHGQYTEEHQQHEQYMEEHQQHVLPIFRALELFEQSNKQHNDQYQNHIQGNQQLRQFVQQLYGYIKQLPPQISNLALPPEQQTQGQLQLNVQQTKEYVRQLRQLFAQSLQAEKQQIEDIKQWSTQQHRITQPGVPYISPTGVSNPGDANAQGNLVKLGL